MLKNANAISQCKTWLKVRRDDDKNDASGECGGGSSGGASLTYTNAFNTAPIPNQLGSIHHECPRFVASPPNPKTSVA